MNYETIKEKAKEIGCSVADLIVLSQNNDPFYVGTPSHKKLADWFAEIWHEFGYSGNVHLRRIHYQIISQETPVFIPDEKGKGPYLNTERCWQRLQKASQYARYLGLVDSGAFDDRRNSRPRVFFGDHSHEYIWDESPRIEIQCPDSDLSDADFEFPSLPYLPVYYAEGFDIEQRYCVEIWAEKSTMNDVLLPLCENHRVNLVTGLGEMSITQVKWLFDRFQHHRKACRILYVSDFDPAGRSMPVAVGRKIEKFMYDLGADYDVRLFPLILTQEQCEHYKLPRTPIKHTEVRGKKFEQRFGEGATELDALEALYPGKLETILENAVMQYRDYTLSDRAYETKKAVQDNADEIADSVIELYQDEIDSITEKHTNLKEQYESAVAEISNEVNELGRQIENVWRAIETEMEDRKPDIDPDDLPEGWEADEIGDGLYSSCRDYYEQLSVYKEFQGKLMQ